MEALRYFFRSEPDGAYFKNYSPSHLILLAITMVGIFIIIKYAKKLANSSHYIYLKKLFGGLLLAQQGILYLWYIFTGYSSIRESLPLYNCRIAIIFTALALITDKKFFKNIAVYWGVYGGILSLLVVEGDPFSFPHYTRLSFFLGHILLLWSTLLILIVDKYKLNRENLLSTIKFTSIYHVFLLGFNILIGANYDYLIKPPVLEELISQLPQALYSIIAIIVFDLLIFIFYKLVIFITQHKNKKAMEGLVTNI